MTWPGLGFESWTSHLVAQWKITAPPKLKRVDRKRKRTVVIRICHGLFVSEFNSRNILRSCCTVMAGTPGLYCLAVITILLTSAVVVTEGRNIVCGILGGVINMLNCRVGFTAGEGFCQFLYNIDLYCGLMECGVGYFLSHRCSITTITNTGLHSASVNVAATAAIGLGPTIDVLA
ncbi:phospholipid scramblase [Plakobranchus ocellatus]|uniref:Phospholipid scramblase n=1 Tax=Plakobranchus ocellatus TaxID=259542 RepID=A0AAV4API2_9GAST|nr:phospholipid scramblase [Plakobranchus ocellatus]